MGNAPNMCYIHSIDQILEIMMTTPGIDTDDNSTAIIGILHILQNKEREISKLQLAVGKLESEIEQLKELKGTPVTEKDECKGCQMKKDCNRTCGDEKPLECCNDNPCCRDMVTLLKSRGFYLEKIEGKKKK